MRSFPTCVRAIQVDRAGLTQLRVDPCTLGNAGSTLFQLLEVFAVALTRAWRPRGQRYIDLGPWRRNSCARRPQFIRHLANLLDRTFERIVSVVTRVESKVRGVLRRSR